MKYNDHSLDIFEVFEIFLKMCEKFKNIFLMVMMCITLTAWICILIIVLKVIWTKIVCNIRYVTAPLFNNANLDIESINANMRYRHIKDYIILR